MNNTVRTMLSLFAVFAVAVPGAVPALSDKDGACMSVRAAQLSAGHTSLVGSRGGAFSTYTTDRIGSTGSVAITGSAHTRHGEHSVMSVPTSARAALSGTARSQEAVLGKPPHEAERIYAFKRDAHGRMLVGVRLNDLEEIPFLFDTAATDTLIYRAAARRLYLVPVSGSGRPVWTATGTEWSDSYDLARLSVLASHQAPARIGSIPGPEDSQAAGIVGVDRMRGWVIGINPQASTLRYDSNAILYDTQAWPALQGRPVGRGSLALDVMVGGETLAFIVDTGASHTVVNSHAARLLVEAGYLDASRSALARGQGASAGSSAEHSGRMPDEASDQKGAAPQSKAEPQAAQVVAGAGGAGAYTRQMTRPLVLQHASARTSQQAATHAEPAEPAAALALYSVTVADLPIFRSIGADHAPAGILGMDVLAGRHLAFDLRGWRLLIAPRE